MRNDFLAGRRKALEDSFFSEKDKQLVEKLRQEMLSESQRLDLSAVSGIQNQEVLNDLLRMELTAETVMALSLVPLVMVAWADGAVSEKERTATLSACEAKGIASSSAAHRLVENWLEEQPSPSLLDAWKNYVAALGETMSPTTKAALKDEVLGHAKAVAEAAGGILGMGNKVSKSEQAKIEELAAAFD